LNTFINDSQGFTRLTKRDFFRLFWASWDTAFTRTNIDSAFRNTGLHPFNPELIIHKFSNKIDSRPSSSGSGASVIPAEDWKRLDRLVKSAVANIHDKNAIQLRDSVSHLSTEVILLKDKIAKLESALINSRKRPNKKKPTTKFIFKK
jgi:hypothetical protein